MNSIWPCVSCGEPAYLRSSWNTLALACPHCFFLDRVFLVGPSPDHHEPHGDSEAEPEIRILAG